MKLKTMNEKNRLIYVISTFKHNSNEIEQIAQSIELIIGDSLGGWFVSSPSKQVFEKIQTIPWAKCLCKEDTSYSEGWNNALELFHATHPTPSGHLLFLGEGDQLRGFKLTPCELNNNTVYCGTTYRIDKSTGSFETHRPAVVPWLFWLRIGAWTPACLFPVKIVKNFKFPSYFVGSDLAIFFHAHNKGVQFKNTNLYSVAMVSGGLSQNFELGRKDYSNILRDFGYSCFWTKLGGAIRWLNTLSCYRLILSRLRALI